MGRTRRFALVYSERVVGHLRSIERNRHGEIAEAISEHLSYTPTLRTRNRKPLVDRAPFGSTWEIRCGPHNRFRVFYEVDQAEGEVHILAIGEKRGNRLYIDGEEYGS